MDRRIIGVSTLAALAAVLLYLAVVAGQASAWRAPATSAPVPSRTHNPVVELELPCCAPLNGTDAGLVTEPAP